MSIIENSSLQIHPSTKSLFKLSLAIGLMLCFFCIACTEPSPLGPTEYAVKNTAPVDVVVRAELLTDGVASLNGDKVTVKAGEELVIATSSTGAKPKVIMKSIEIWNKIANEKYTTLDLADFSTAHNRYTITVALPALITADLIDTPHSLNVHMNKTTIFGFYPKVDYPRETHYFSTDNLFQNITKTPTPQTHPNSSMVMADVFGSTMIGFDETAHIPKTQFIISDNNGLSWETFFEFGFDSENDYFMGADFIDKKNGWLFNYVKVYHGHDPETLETHVYKYKDGVVNKISSIINYCVYKYQFIDESDGYAFANTPDNTMPAGSRNTYFFKTQDGGVTWSEPVLVSETDVISKFFVLNDGKFIAFPDPSLNLEKYYYVSHDGTIWEKKSVAINGNIRDLFFLPSGVGYIKTGVDGGWAFENVGDLYKTVDGEQWGKVTEGINGSRVWFYNEDIGYLQGTKNYGQILNVTYDGGKTWKCVLYPHDYLMGD